MNPTLQAHIIEGEQTISDDDLCAYLAVLDGALGVHLDRERIRRGLWKEYPPKDQFNQIRIKIDRVMRTLEIIEQAKDGELITALKAEIESECHDIINYATFGLRQL